MAKGQKVGKLLCKTNPERIIEPKIQLNEVTEDVNALSWIPDSATDLLVATEDSMMIWDIRMLYQIKT